MTTMLYHLTVNEELNQKFEVWLKNKLNGKGRTRAYQRRMYATLINKIFYYDNKQYGFSFREVAAYMSNATEIGTYLDYYNCSLGNCDIDPEIAEDLRTNLGMEILTEK